MTKPRTPRKPTTPATQAHTTVTGAVVASDGSPVFGDGLSRRQWLAAHADERKAAFIAELRQTDEAKP